MIAEIFISFIYQPFLNILVGFYWLLGLFSDGKPDMGIAVIFLTILIRILLLPLALSANKSEGERRDIAHKIKDIEKTFDSEPIKREQMKKQVLKSSRKVILSELFNLFIQVSIALMLWKIFQTGLVGADIHLIYSFMPEIELPFNLVFLGKYDLTHTNLILNLTQSFLIFVLESLSLFTSYYPVSRKEVIRMQLVLPIVSFIIFMGLPAGKKLFVITSLIFSIILLLIRVIRRAILSYMDRKEAEMAGPSEEKTEEKIVVEVK